MSKKKKNYFDDDEHSYDQDDIIRPVQKMVKCTRCDGKGTLSVTCDDCNGEGEVPAESPESR